ncbi:hypothetical protein DKX38_018551 [Salix brachista]|uniref:Uncharacterized protein n=1 Tax=Salix brachista TaxID=2182728 RepID=A0A5N5KNG6_9ROSI|nr:hypothetical protein DKX38_018551 [Salix brachista]
MARMFEYFVVCGLGPEMRTVDGNKGYHGMRVFYLSSLLDQYPPDNHSLYPPAPPQLPTCVLPAGVELYPSGFDANVSSTFPRSYPIVLTEGDGSKIYVSCVAFRDPVIAVCSLYKLNACVVLLIFLKFFASILGGYRNFLENTVTHAFNTQAFLKKRSRLTNQPPDPMITQFLESHGFLDYLERGIDSDGNNNNLLDKLQDTIGRGQNPMSILPTAVAETEIITISDPDVGILGSGAKYTYDRFPSNIRSEEQEEKRKQILAAARGAFEYIKHAPSSPSVQVGKDSLSPMERAAERERMVLDIQVKLQSHFVKVSVVWGSSWVEKDQGPAIPSLWDCMSVHYIKLRGFLTHIQQIRVNYWGISSVKAQSMLSHGLSSPRPKDSMDENQQPAEASVIGRSWVQSMFSRDSSRATSFGRVHKGAFNGTSVNEIGTPRKQDLTAGQKKFQTNVRILRGHSGAITAVHCVTRREVWDLVGDREDAGFFISGSTDCMVKIWDPSIRGSELRATLKGHTRTVRAISSDRGKVVSGSDDQSVIVWDKQTSQLLEELKGHDAQVSCVRMLSGERVLTAAHDGTVKMWDVRTDTCVATVGRCSSAVLCMEYDDSTGILAAAGRDAVANIWDIRAGRQMHKLLGHTKWIRSIRMVGDTLITGSDDWTARVWSVSRGTCDAVLACHAGPILCVEYSMSDRGIITGSTDGLLRFWENEEGGIRCVKNVTIHSAPILSINAGEHWLGIGAADNSMSLFHRPQERLGGFSSTGSKMAGWQLYRTPQRTVAMIPFYLTNFLGDLAFNAQGIECSLPSIDLSSLTLLLVSVSAIVRCVASDLERKRICSGGRNGVLSFVQNELGMCSYLPADDKRDGSKHEEVCWGRTSKASIGRMA